MTARRKIIILALLFVLTVFLSMAGGKEAGSTETRGNAFADPSFPLMCFSWQDRLINPLYGRSGIRERGAEPPSVFPFLTEELSLEIHLLDGREAPRSISYELRDEQDKRLVARGKVEDWEEKEGEYIFSVAFDNIIESDRYYELNWTVSFSSREAEYHTRVMKVSEAETVNMLTSYALNMHEDLFRKDTARAYASQLETDTFSDKDTMARVSLKSSFDQFSWGETAAKRVSESWMRIEAIQGNFLYLSFRYLAEAPLEETPVTFRVEESLSLQRYGLAVFLLNYERQMDQLWSFQESAVVSEGFLLGVQGDETPCLTSSQARFYCFAVAGNLYLFDSQELKLIKIYSLFDGGAHPLRILQKESKYRLISVSDEGQVEFAVYGSVTAGPREGGCGISYCRYDMRENKVEEQMFLPSSKAPASLIAEVERLFLKGQDNFLYFILDEELLVMDVDTGETAVLVPREDYPGLVISEAGDAFAWASETDQVKPAALRLINASSGLRETVTASSDEFLKPLGFLRDDLVVGYGPREAEPVQDGAAGRFPYERLVIYNDALELIHNYHFDGIWIDRVEIESDKMRIHRFSLKDGTYGYLDEDIMLRNDQEQERSSRIGTIRHETLKKLSILRCDKPFAFLRVEQQDIRLFAEGQYLSLPAAQRETPFSLRYFAYGKNGLLGAFSEPGGAISLAAGANGYVLDREGRLAWCWVGRQEACELEMNNTFLEDTAQMVNVSGSSLREYMFFLHRGIPLRWVRPEGGDLWLVGYEWKNVLLYNPANAAVFRMLQSDFDADIARDNNYLWVKYP